jgi:hypothetical protein
VFWHRNHGNLLTVKIFFFTSSLSFIFIIYTSIYKR